MTTSTGVPFFAIFATVEQCCECMQGQDLSGGLHPLSVTRVEAEETGGLMTST